MIDELVKPDTARLAKEKGFDELMSSYYTKDDKIEEFYEGDKYRNSDLSTGYFKENMPGIISAPTQSLLQRWLREKHNIHVESMFFGHEKEPGDYFYNIDLPRTDPEVVNWKTDNKRYATYEEALEVGLVEALKLIPLK